MLILLFGGGWYGYNRGGAAWGGGWVGIVLVILLILYLTAICTELHDEQ